MLIFPSEKKKYERNIYTLKTFVSRLLDFSCLLAFRGKVSICFDTSVSSLVLFLFTGLCSTLQNDA